MSGDIAEGWIWLGLLVFFAALGAAVYVGLILLEKGVM